MVVMGEVTLGEPGGMCSVVGGSQLHSSGGGVRPRRPLAVGPAAAPVQLVWCRVIRCVEALRGELQHDVPLRRLLRGPPVGSALLPVEGDLMAPSPAVVGEEAENGVLLRVLHALHVCSHVGDIDGVLFLPFLCGGAWRWGAGGVPVEPRPRDVGHVVLEGSLVLGGALAGFEGGLVAPQGVGQVCPAARLRGGGHGGAFCGPGWPGSAGLLVAGSGIKQISVLKVL